MSLDQLQKKKREKWQSAFHIQYRTYLEGYPSQEGVLSGKPHGVVLAGWTVEGESPIFPNLTLHNLPPTLLALTLLVHFHELVQVFAISAALQEQRRYALCSGGISSPRLVNLVKIGSELLSDKWSLRLVRIAIAYYNDNWRLVIYSSIYSYCIVSVTYSDVCSLELPQESGNKRRTSIFPCPHTPKVYLHVLGRPLLVRELTRKFFHTLLTLTVELPSAFPNTNYNTQVNKICQHIARTHF